MAISRLDNFLKSVRGTILHVNPDSLDSTDSITNTGSSPVRPFKTIQRAIAEAVRYSYQSGRDNDRFNRTTILLYPGEHFVDNRPGYIPDGSNTFRTRSGEIAVDLTEWDNTTSYDLSDPNNALYKLNSVHGGVILPRGVSIVGQDLRKTTIRPLYVPNPVNDNIESSAIFRVTGGCFIYGFTIFDADPNGVCYKDYTKNLFLPNFSHHKLNVFEFADGVNGVDIKDDFLTYSTSRTDLEMLYEKVGLVYGASSGRAINNDYPSTNIDIDPVIDEVRIVGSRGKEVGISSIFSGDSIISSDTITVNLSEEVTDISTDTPIQIQGVSSSGYNGQYVVSSVLNSTTVQYKVQNPPATPSPTLSGATLSITVDSVTSASPYIFNCTLRSVYGMCGLLADGKKSSGFKSMMVAQFTGIGLQKDSNAFVRYDLDSGIYLDSTEVANLQSDTKAIYKPSYENYHIKATNDSFLQLVSIFSIGFSQHYIAENGGDFSITNSNSNFGSKALVSRGYREDAFVRDNFGYITHIINPKDIDTPNLSVEFLSIDVSKTISVGNTSRLYLYGYESEGNPPNHVIDGYRIGAKENDELYVQISNGSVTNTYSAKIIMPNTEYTTTTTSKKSFSVDRSVSGTNSIGISGDDVIDLTAPHTFINGEKVKIFSEDGSLPDGILTNQMYYVITGGSLSDTQIKLAQSESNAIVGNAINLSSGGGKLHIISDVIDKISGDYGHPIQFDIVNNGWYLNVSGNIVENNIYPTIVSLGTAGIGQATSRTYILRRQDDRRLNDKVYKVRYVIPKDSPLTARPPLEGYVIQEASSGIGTGTEEIQKYFSNSTTLVNSNELRNLHFISNAAWNSNVVTVTTELSHNLSVGSYVKIENISPSGYNGTYVVTGTPSSRQFTYSLTTDPGLFASDTTIRDSSLPRFSRAKYNETYFIYKAEEIQSYIPNSQDGVYHLTLLNSSNSPTIAPFNNLKFPQPIQNFYPQLNRDNPDTNPRSAKSYALPNPIGQVVINNPERSITRETIEKNLFDSQVGAGITNIISLSETSHVIYTRQDHEFSGISTLITTSSGSNYLEGTYYGIDLIGGSGSSASARVTVNATGNVSSVSIMHPGGGYVVGETLSVVPPVGVGTTSGFTPATVQVASVENNINDVICVYGISANDYEQYNTHYRISSINGPNQFSVVSTTNIPEFTSTGIGITLTENSSYIRVGKTVPVSSITYNSSTGTALVGFSTSHGFITNNKIIFSGADDDFFNGEFNITNVLNSTVLTINTGIATASPLTSGNIIAHRTTLSSSLGDEHINQGISGRSSFEYAGITTVIGSVLNYDDPDNTPITIPNAISLGLKLGDYLLINDEIFRVRSTVSGNNISVFRSLFGTKRQDHFANSIVYRINVKPVELRRNSIIRASSHTFEYLGFGPGNYSSALPERQDRILSSSEEILSQATKYDGGAIVFSGMNSDGDFYTGNKIIRSSTGQEEIYNSPIPSVSGEELSIGNVTSELISSSDLFIFRSLKVEGGPDNNLISEFSGPVLFNNKVLSSNGIETKDLYIQGDGDVSRRFTVLNSKPTYSGNYGDVVWNSLPQNDGVVGWIYTVENDWQPFGTAGEIKVGVSTGASNNYVGLATQLNFIGYGLSVTSNFNSNSGIATISIDASDILTSIVGLTSSIAGLGSTSVGVGSTSIIVNVNTPATPNYSIQYNSNSNFAGVPSLLYDSSNNTLNLTGSSSNSLLNINQTGSGYALVVEDVYIPGTGYVGLGSTAPSAKLDIFAPSQQAVKIRSFSGSGNIVSIENQVNDTSPIIFDVQGNLGINTIAATEKLSVYGNALVTGDVLIAGVTTTNYIGFRAPTLSSNFTYILPNSYGSNGQILVSNGAGGLSWANNIGFTSSNVLAGSGISVTYQTVDGQLRSTVSNTGVQKIIAGTGVTVSPASGIGTVTISVRDITVTTPPYPFTTPGFSMPI